MASRILSRRRFLPFVKRMNERYDDGWVHRDICARLERFSDDVAAKKSPRLMLLMPPRHGKSELASRNFPAWHLGRHADHELIACSYNLSLAMTFSRKVKQLIEDPLYKTIFDTRLDSSNQSTEEWAVAGRRGGYVAAGIGGGITGKGADILLIDDPMKSAEDADSGDGREKIWEWYMSTAYTRLAPGGGVLVIQCMTGDTPVLLPDGTHRRLGEVRAGDTVATFEDGRLTASIVSAWKSNGRDRILKITTISGKVVRSNGRHPFLVSDAGGLKWVRAQNLTTDHKIVAVAGSGGNGGAWHAPQRGASCQPSAEVSALRITGRKNGLMDTAHPPSTQNPTAQRISNTATASPPKNTLGFWIRRAVNALSAAASTKTARRRIGVAGSASTTATTLEKSAACSATTATPQQGTQRPSASRWPWLNTSDFTTDQVVSVEPDGVEEVFDVQIERTENFIANGLVSHNTWWHDDDLAGRLQQMMAAHPDDPDVDQFEVIKYPAIAVLDEYLDPATGAIVYEAPTPAAVPLRLKGEALHPTRYDLPKLNKIRALNRKSDGSDGRWWSALYQQNPVPDDGSYFTKEQFRRRAPPHKSRCNVFIAWDFAISEKKQNDYTVGTVGLQDEDDVLHIADVVRFRSQDAFFIVESILDLAEKWYSPTLILGFEDGQIYKAISAVLKKRMLERKIYPAVEVLVPITDKMARARAIQGRMQQGMVSFHDSAEWYDVVKAEMLRFPAGVHDDCVDSLAWVGHLVIKKPAPRRAKTPEMKSWRDKLKGFGANSVGHMSA